MVVFFCLQLETKKYVPHFINKYFPTKYIDTQKVFSFWLSCIYAVVYTLLFSLLLFLCSLQKELNGMIVQEKIVESKHQKKEITEVCVLICFLAFKM